MGNNITAARAWVNKSSLLGVAYIELIYDESKDRAYLKQFVQNRTGSGRTLVLIPECVTIDTGYLENVWGTRLEIELKGDIEFVCKGEVLEWAQWEEVFSGDIHSLVIKEMNSSKCKKFEYMFLELSVKELDVSGVDVSNATSLDGMFYHADVREITGFDKWNTEKLKSADYMFKGAGINVNYLNYMDISNASIEEAFVGTDVIETVDLKWNNLSRILNEAVQTRQRKYVNCIDASNMSWDSTSLEAIECVYRFILPSVKKVYFHVTGSDIRIKFLLLCGALFISQAGIGIPCLVMPLGINSTPYIDFINKQADRINNNMDNRYVDEEKQLIAWRDENDHSVPASYGESFLKSMKYGMGSMLSLVKMVTDSHCLIYEGVVTKDLYKIITMDNVKEALGIAYGEVGKLENFNIS